MSTHAVSGFRSSCGASPPHPSRLPHSDNSCGQVDILPTGYTMKLALFLILTAILCLSNGGPYKLLTGSMAKKTLGSSLRSWAHTHSGVIASKTLSSLLGTLGLLGSIEIVNIARNAASDPDDQQALDSLLSSLIAMKDSRAKARNSLNLDGVYVSIGGVVLFSIAMTIMVTVNKCCKKNITQSDTTSTQISPDQGIMSESESIKVISHSDPTKVEGDEIVNIESKM